jgi:4-alpha-glucanotransferase
MRKSGILLPIFSLPNSYGIGTLGKEAYQFVDFLVKSHQSYWQVLPLGPTSYGDSPYQSFSVFAGNPYFIDFDLLSQDGLLDKSDYDHCLDESLKIDYEKIYFSRFEVLRKAYKKFDIETIKEFENENSDWLNDYAIFMALKELHNGVSFLEWDKKYQIRDKKALQDFVKDNLEEINFWKFLQYEFYKQWNELRTYANLHGIKIIGDMPIYTALDSSDVWSHPELFQLDKNLRPKMVAGCPADDFTPLGQLWGNPLYNYSAMKKDNYKWWVRRVEVSAKLFDTIRIDHFRGFEAYFAIPAGDENALGGHWKKGPNVKLFNAIKKSLGDIDIIAENLGFITKEVDLMLEKLGYPGMKILQFAFDPKNDSEHAPHNLTYNTVVYTGTHDNPPVRSWYESLGEVEKEYFHEYLHFDSPYEIVNEMVRTALSSVCYLAVIPLYDYLQKGDEARINTPSKLGGNWTWRMSKGDMNKDLSAYIAKLTDTYKRYQEEEKESEEEIEE